MSLAVRPAAVAGRFYPGQRAALVAEVDACLEGVPRAATAARAPNAVKVPHARYVYSGAVAAHA